MKTPKFDELLEAFNDLLVEAMNLYEYAPKVQSPEDYFKEEIELSKKMAEHCQKECEMKYNVRYLLANKYLKEQGFGKLKKYSIEELRQIMAGFIRFLESNNKLVTKNIDLPESFQEIFDAIDNGSVEIILHGNDGFDGNDTTQGNEHMKKWINDAYQAIKEMK